MIYIGFIYFLIQQAVIEQQNADCEAKSRTSGCCVIFVSHGPSLTVTEFTGKKAGKAVHLRKLFKINNLINFNAGLISFL
ncbi:hypothetical protein [Photobacterium sp. Hal280]|uniref:hypothetical protein n=1 Tax=Photobacterium sp. Hal280 TaxID=3035163 RepID=UPI00301DC2E4